MFSRRGVVFLACVLAVTPLAAQEVPVVERTLSNGMRLVMVERHEQPTIAFGWLARVGSANERPGMTGMAHLFEHMMFKGTKTIGTRDAKRDAELNDLQDKVQAQIREEMSILRERQRRGEIANMMDPKVRTPRLQQLLEEFDRLVQEQRALVVKDEMDKIYTQAGGTGLNASTSEDRTFYIVSLPSNKLELWCWIESDRLANPVFREFYSERDVILEERRQTLESRPGGVVGEAFNALTWMASPYHWEVIGWPSDISQVTREQANEFFATYYAPNNLTAILVGDFDPAKAYALAEKYFGRIPANPKGVPEVITMEPPQPAEQRMIAEVETQPSVQVDFKTVPGVHKDAAALQALAGILGGAPMFMGRPGGPGGMRAPDRTPAEVARARAEGGHQRHGLLARHEAGRAVFPAGHARAGAEPGGSGAEALRRDREDREGRRHRRGTAALQERLPGGPVRAPRIQHGHPRDARPVPRGGNRRRLQARPAGNPGPDQRRREAGGDAVSRQGEPQRPDHHAQVVGAGAIPDAGGQVMVARIVVGLALAASTAFAQIPDRPEKLRFDPIVFQTPRVKDYQATLKNGIPVFIASTGKDGTPLVRVTASWRGGSYLDPKGKEGLAALFGSQLTQGGTAKLDPAALDDRLEALAASLTSACADTSCSLSLQVLEKDLDEGLDLFVQALTQPAFAQDRLDLAKRLASQRLSRRNDDVTSIASYQMAYLLFGDQHFASAGDTRASLEAITREDLVAAHARMLHPANLVDLGGRTAGSQGDAGHPGSQAGRAGPRQGRAGEPEGADAGLPAEARDLRERQGRPAGDGAMGVPWDAAHGP